MTRSDRVDKLEREAGPQRCPECGGKQIFEERRPDGSVTFEGDPCPVCDSPNRIIVTFGNNRVRDDGDYVSDDE